MSAAAAEEYIASLYATVLKRDPRPDEFASWVTTAAALPPEQVYFAFVNSKEHKRQLEQSVPSMFLPGHYYSPIVDPSTIAEYVEKQYLQEPGDIEGIVFDEDAMVRFWKENAEFIKNTPFSEHDDGKNRFYYDNDNFPYGDAITLRAMIAHFKPKNVIEIGSGFSSACMLDAVDHVGLSDFTMTCIDPDADRLRSRLREEDRSRVEIIEGLVQDVPVSTFSKLKENDILFIDSTHVLKTASDVHYELFSILPSLNKGVLVHFHDIQYPFEYPRQWLFESNYSWNEIYALRAFLMYNSAFEVVFWNGLFAHRQRELVDDTNPLFLKNPGGSMWLRARSVDILQTQHAQIGVTGGPQVKMNEFLHGLRPNLAVSDGDTMYSAAAARHYEFVGRSDLSVVLNALNLRATHPGGDAAISDVFDFGCGHGRATRWFRAAFPEAAIWVTDYDQAGVDWCVKQFGCKDTGGEIPADRFDVVWLGSVFTHLPRQIVEGLIDNLLKSLKPNGLLIFTTQGRFAVGMMEAFLTSSDVPGWMHYNLERDSVEDLIRQYNEEGYGFVNYPHQTDYGVCVAKSHWYSDRILKHDRYIQILMEEKGSDNHQDVHAFMRAYLSDLGKGPLY